MTDGKARSRARGQMQTAWAAWALAAALALGITGPAAAAEIDWTEQIASALKAAPELAIDGLEAGDAGKERLARLEANCVQPSVRALSEAVDATGDQLRREPLQALDGLLPTAAAVDQRLNRCLVAQGARGSASYVLDGRHLSAYAYVQTLKRIVSDTLEASARPAPARSGGARR